MIIAVITVIASALFFNWRVHPNWEEIVRTQMKKQLEKSNQPITGENLLKLRKENGTFDLVGGKMEFLPNGSVSMPIQINEVDGGAGKMVKAGVMAK